MTDYFFIDITKESIIKIFQDKGYIFFISIPLTLSLMICEAIKLGWKNSSLYRILKDRSNATKTDLVLCFLGATNLYLYIGLVLSFGTASVLPTMIREYFGYNLIQNIHNPIIQTIFLILFYDFILYWKHRFNHHIRCLWEIHKYHHSAREFNIITAHRLHPFGTAIWMILWSFPFAIAGVHFESYFTFRIIINFIESLKHSNLPYHWGWFGKYILVSPTMHKVHHSINPRYFNKNFGVISPIWDHLFGTWHSQEIEDKSIGLINNPFDHKQWYQDMLDVYVNFWKVLLEDLKKLFTIPIAKFTNIL